MKNEFAGVMAGRYMKSIAIAQGNHRAAGAFAQSQSWADRKEIAQAAESLAVEKAAVSAMGIPGGLEDTTVGQDFLAAFLPISIRGNLPRVRRMPFNTRVLSFAGGATGYMVAEGAATPMSVPGIDGVFLRPKKSVALTMVTEEVLRNSGKETEQSLTNDLAAAAAKAQDIAFIDPGTSGSVLNGVTGTASAGTTLGNVDTDLKAAIGSLVAAGSTLEVAAWVLSPTTATNLSLMRGSGGAPAYPTLTVNGGTLAGLPAVVSAGVSGYIALLDQAGLIFGEEDGVTLKHSTQGTFQMLTNPTNNSLTPTPTTTVSAFQTNSRGLMAEIYGAWYGRPGSTAFISGVSY